MLTNALFGSVRWSIRSLVLSATVGFALLIGAAVIAQAQDVSAEPATDTTATQTPTGQPPSTTAEPESLDQAQDASDSMPQVRPAPASNRVAVLIGSLTIFVLAIFVGFEVINKVPPTLHTPLMSGSNAISGITIVGAILATGFEKIGFGSFLGTAAIILAMINVAGGFWVTHRMLAMFKKKK
jgi:NAD(P) transhydrogenase subunit alpha